MKKTYALIIVNHTMCNLRCSHCQGLNADKLDIVLKPPKKLPNRITLTELQLVINFLKSKIYICKDKFIDIRFGGNWCEPTLDSELSQKIKYLLQITKDANCKIKVHLISNGINIPSGKYSENFIKKYFLKNFGFEIIPKRFRLTISTDNEHLNSFVRRRKLEERISSGNATQEYLEKVANLIHYGETHRNLKNIMFNIVKPTNSLSNFEHIMRKKFGIPNNFNIDILRRAVYSPLQEKLPNSVNLKGKFESPLNKEYCYFITKRKREIVIFPDIYSFGHNTNAVPYKKFKFNN